MHDIRLDSITTQIENIMKSITNIQNTLKDIQLQINEEKKDNNNDNMKKKFDEIGDFFFCRCRSWMMHYRIE